MTAETLDAATLAEIAPFVRPGFPEAWRRMARTYGYRQLARAVESVTPANEPTRVIIDAGRRSPGGRSSNTYRPRGGEVCWGAVKYTRTGTTINRKHRCGPACRWTGAECLDWLRTVKLPHGGGPTRLLPAPHCPCGLTPGNHVEWRAKDSKFLGAAFIPCEYRTKAPARLADWTKTAAEINAENAQAFVEEVVDANAP